jgi:hypothetical protein
MKKTIITVALLAVLTSLAVSCQKEEADITSATPSTVIAENDTHRTVVYSIDGVSYRLTLVGDQAWHDFLSRMFALAEEGHTVTFFNEEAASRCLPSKVVETHSTSNKEDAYQWSEQKVKEGYTVTIVFDEETGIYTCYAFKQ